MVDHVTPLRNRRRYTRKEKLAAVMAAEVGTLTAAAEQTGIPKSTIAYWAERPEFVQFRTKTREDLADEVRIAAHLAWQRVSEALRDGTMEPRDALFAADKASTILQLLSGEATSRTESRDVTGNLGDHERQALADAVDAWLRETADVDASP